jgi:ATP-dependent DNA helicase DinG
MSSTDILAPNGPLSKLLEGYSPRPQQIEMAEAVARALDSGESLICEAGTGTGKTFAYLVPALLSGRRVIVSTGTRSLQDQLYDRDLPLARRAARVAANLALLKGRANYLCLHRLRLAERDGGATGRAAGYQLGRIREWSLSTSSGDLAEMPALPEESPLRGTVTSTTENCLGQGCDFYEDCFVFKARRLAEGADLIVVNHHLYLADLGLRERGHGELLPAADAVIFDEAHQLPELASQFFSRTLSGNQWLELARDARAAYVEEAADLPEFPAALDRLEKAVRDLRLAAGDADGARAWQELAARPAVAAAFASLLDCAHDAHGLLQAFAERGKLLDHCCRRAAELLDQLGEFQDSAGADHVQWLEIRGRGFLLHCTPLDVAAAYQSRVEGSGAVRIYTSATLSVNGNFDHFASQLGLQSVAARSWPSPFDFRRQAVAYVPEGLPDPRAEGYTELAVEAALPVLELTRGRAFFLFTSHRALCLAAERIRPLLGFPVFVQGEMPRTELLETFREAGHAVLLGTGSFWEGVDVRGQALSCVIIDKLPFASPDDPVLQARLRRMEEENRNPFMEYQLPEAVIALRQGIGRLIRDAADYGVLMICDPRILTKSYGRIFRNSLPDMEWTRSLAGVRSFLQLHESPGGAGNE